MGDHPNAARAREIFDAMNAGDAGAADALAEDVRWHVIGSDRPIVGKDAVLASFQGLSDAGFHYATELHDVVANDDHVVALITATVTKDGETFTYRTAEIAHLRDGKITERWAFAEDTEAINRFFGS